MARQTKWNDDYWLPVMQLYMKRPQGVKPLYGKETVQLSMELHIAPQQVQARMTQLAALDTPRTQQLWKQYSQNPKRLARAVRLLREMKGYGNADEFYEGVEINETFERDFRQLEADERLTPVALILVLHLYFQLTPITMVAETPEVQELARRIKVPASLVAEVLDIYQHCDPYLKRRDVVFSPLLLPCQQVWERYGEEPNGRLAELATQLYEYFK